VPSRARAGPCRAAHLAISTYGIQILHVLHVINRGDVVLLAVQKKIK
jgi:hypothetical protein